MEIGPLQLLDEKTTLFSFKWETQVQSGGLSNGKYSFICPYSQNTILTKNGDGYTLLH